MRLVGHERHALVADRLRVADGPRLTVDPDGAGSRIRPVQLRLEPARRLLAAPAPRGAIIRLRNAGETVAKRAAPRRRRRAPPGRAAARTAPAAAGEDAEADRRVADLHVKTLEEILARQAEQVASLQTRLDEAIEGASGARALAHVNQIAMEQARTRPPQG